MNDQDQLSTDKKGRCIIEEVKWQRAIHFNNMIPVNGFRHDTPGIVQIALDYGRSEIAVKYRAGAGTKVRRLPVDGNVEWYEAFAWKDVPKPKGE